MKIQSHTIFSRPRVQPQIPSGNTNSLLPEKIDQQKDSGTKYGSQSLIPRSPPQLQELPKLRKVEDVEQLTRNNYIPVQEGLLNKQTRILVRISSVFPFEFFPNIIEVEENKITVILKQFFACSQIHSIDMKDISNVFVETAPFFATVKIITRNYIENNVQVHWLKKGEALYARNIIEGLRIFSQERVDTSKYELNDLVKRLESLSNISITMHQA